VRKALETLVTQARRNGALCCKAELFALTNAGHELYKALFREWERRDVLPQQVQGYLSRPETRYALRITLEDTLFIPWGLVYGSTPTDPGDVHDPVDVRHYGGFWCLRYSPAALYNRIQARFEAEAIRRDAFTLVPVLNREVYDGVVAQLEAEDVAALKLYDEFKPAYSTREPFERWQSVSQLNGLLYFLCHASSSALDLSATDRLSAAAWINNLTKDATDYRTACLVFVNGCLTATETEKSSFLEASAEHGFVGFIGTEAKVPNLFAQRFGMEFIRGFIRGGEPLFQLMERLRLAHWPLSLLYSVYCFPSLCLLPRPGQDAADPPATNASFKRLGTTDLVS
jgi:hypothetical protein